MKMITVFTPTYNRANLIHKCYESLKRQTSKDFEWLVIDDGSTDNTKELIQSWINTETEFEIRYIYKENGGLHTGYNEAIANLKTELAVCIDSDDYLTDNCIELIKDKWENTDSKENYAGIIGLDVFVDGYVLGGRFPDIQETNWIDILIQKVNIPQCDKKTIVRSDLYKEVAPMPVFHGEKNFNPHRMILQISETYNFLLLNEPLCVVEYQNDGMSASMWWQYYNSPNSFLEIRKQYLSFDCIPFKFKIKNTIHLISSCLLAKRNVMKECNNKFYAIVLYPAGWILSKVILGKNKK